MTGTFVNTGAILAGSLIGVSAGKYLPDRIKTTVMQALGLSQLKNSRGEKRIGVSFSPLFKVV